MTKKSYEEVMPLVSILSHYYPAGTREITDEGKHKGAISVYIDLPAGQCYWRVSPEHLYLFSHLKAYPQAWCGEPDVNLARLQETAKIEQLWEGEIASLSGVTADANRLYIETKSVDRNKGKI